MQQKTNCSVQFEITSITRNAVAELIDYKQLKGSDYLFGSRHKPNKHLSCRQYARVVDSWVNQIGLDPTDHGTHSLRRTKASIILSSN